MRFSHEAQICLGSKVNELIVLKCNFYRELQLEMSICDEIW